jgi:hypothetical protein
MNLFRWLAASTRRLTILACVSLSLVLGTASVLSSWIREESSSMVLDMGILTGYVALMLAAALALAVLLGDRLFPYRWRERVVLGIEVPPPDAEDPMLPPVLYQTHLGAFTMLLLTLIICLSGVLEVATSGLFAEYQKVGHMRTILRTENTALKLELLAELSQARRETNIESALTVVDLAWRDKRQPPAVRKAGLNALGRLSYSLATSMDSWLKQGIDEHWELEVLRHLRSSVAPELRSRFPTESEPLGIAMTLALGKMRDWRSTDALAQYVKEHASDPDARTRAAISALGLSRDAQVLGRLTEIAETLYPTKAFLELSFATGDLIRNYAPGLNDDIDAVFPEIVKVYAKLGKDKPFEHQCLAMDVLRKTGDARVTEHLFAAFEQEGAEAICPTVSAEIGEQAPALIVATEPFRLRIIRGLAMVAVGNDEVTAWAEARKDDEQYSEFVRGQLREMLRLIEANQ